MYRSGLRTRFERHLTLTAGEIATLEGADHRQLRLQPGDVLLTEGTASAMVYVVHKGWLHMSTRLPGGARQIVRFHAAGDLMATWSIALPHSPGTLTAILDCVVAEVPTADFGALFADHPRLAGLLCAIAASDNIAMADRLTSIGRTGASDRLSTLLLTFLSRVRMTDGPTDAFDMPLTQGDIADALGLTKVHVNRTLRGLERDGLIARDGRRIRILDETTMIRNTGFIDRCGTIQTDWLPPPRDQEG